jgi:hypothetical protein
MPFLATLAIALGAILIAATAADGRLWQSSQTALSVSFDPSQYRTAPGCLRGAYKAGAPSSACAGER